MRRHIFYCIENIRVKPFVILLFQYALFASQFVNANSHNSHPRLIWPQVFDAKETETEKGN